VGVGASPCPQVFEFLCEQFYVFYSSLQAPVTDSN
jgi:hypothetical protein